MGIRHQNLSMLVFTIRFRPWNLGPIVKNHSSNWLQLHQPSKPALQPNNPTAKAAKQTTHPTLRKPAIQPLAASIRPRFCGRRVLQRASIDQASRASQLMKEDFQKQSAELQALLKRRSAFRPESNHDSVKLLCYIMSYWTLFLSIHL